MVANYVSWREIEWLSSTLKITATALTKSSAAVWLRAPGGRAGKPHVPSTSSLLPVPPPSSALLTHATVAALRSA